MGDVDIFADIYRNNYWGGLESRSGTGSDMGQTDVIRRELPLLLKRRNIWSILDIPCGDFNWMQHVDLSMVRYIGADIVPDIIKDNKRKFPTKDFRVLDITKDKLPEVDAIFCRDLLGHFSNENVERALEVVRASGAKYLIATSFPFVSKMMDIEDGKWRPINLEHYDMAPVEYIDEELFDNRGINVGKFMGVFKI